MRWTRVGQLVRVLCGFFIAVTALLKWQTINRVGHFADLRVMQTNRPTHMQWMTAQLRRLERIKKGCKILSDERPKYTSNNILVDSNHQVVYCSVPKCACSSWKSLIAILGNKTTNFTHNDIHSPDFMESLGIKELKRLPHKDQNRIMKEYPKFLVIRHPLERLVSAFRDKLEAHDKNANHFHKLYDDVILTNYHSPNDSNPNVTFPDFVSFLLDPKQDFDMKQNQHWNPYSDICFLCSIDYSYVIDYDNFNTDSEQVLRLLFNSTIDALPHANIERSNSKAVYKEYMSMLTDEQVKGLKERYKKDFFLFGYE